VSFCYEQRGERARVRFPSYFNFSFYLLRHRFLRHLKDTELPSLRSALPVVLQEKYNPSYTISFPTKYTPFLYQHLTPTTFIRSRFCVSELSGGFSSPLANNEVPFTLLEIWNGPYCFPLRDALVPWCLFQLPEQEGFAGRQERTRPLPVTQAQPCKVGEDDGPEKVIVRPVSNSRMMIELSLRV
jgi:hypothetical protein